MEQNTMPDITMCTNKKCSRRKTCYRANATPQEQRQSYAFFDPATFAACEWYALMGDELREHQEKQTTATDAQNGCSDGDHIPDYSDKAAVRRA
jgi:hypothetical protein